MIDIYALGAQLTVGGWCYGVYWLLIGGGLGWAVWIDFIKP